MFCQNIKTRRATGEVARQLSGNLTALGSNHSTVQVILLEGKSPDIQIFISPAMSAEGISEAAVEISEHEKWIKWFFSGRGHWQILGWRDFSIL